MKEQGLRERLLTLPAMAALVLSLVYRQIPSLSELVRVLAFEGLLWIDPMEVTKQALSKRLRKLPASLFARLFKAVIERLQDQPASRAPVLQDWQQRLSERFSALWIADGSTLEALRHRVEIDQQEVEEAKESSSLLGGKMMMLVEAFTTRPVEVFYEAQAQADDKRFTQQLLNQLPEGGLMVFDMGFFSFPFFDAVTDADKYYLTRLRQKTSYERVMVLAEGPRYRDEIIEMGLYRSNPCKHRVRMISVLWGQTWYRYITNVLDPDELSAQEATELYRSRWRIETAFKHAKRLLGLSYLWVGGRNGVQVQLYATWILYAVLMDLCAELAQTLGCPLHRISVEMVFRGLYHYSRAEARGATDDVVQFMVKHHELLGLIKAERKQHRKIDARKLEIWGTLLS